MSTLNCRTLWKTTTLLALLAGSSACNTFDPPKHIDTDDWQKATREVVAEYAPIVEPRIKPYFNRASVRYPPAAVSLLTFKHERRMELWARSANGQWRFIKNYHLKATSGVPGPKLREADHQIPEGVYHIVELNPFSRLRLSMKLDYPNAFDLYHARVDRRSDLGGNIFIHGKKLSVGCLAVGDSSIDELFVLIAKTGLEHTQVIIAPNDLRLSAPMNIDRNDPGWITSLDDRLERALIPFKV